MNPTTLIIGGVGALLIYCAVTDKDPRTVIGEALSPRRKGSAGPNPQNRPIVVAPAPTYTGDPSAYFRDYFKPNV